MSRGRLRGCGFSPVLLGICVIIPLVRIGRRLWASGRLSRVRRRWRRYVDVLCFVCEWEKMLTMMCVAWDQGQG